MEKCIFCGKWVSVYERECEWVKKKHNRGKKDYFHRSCYLKTTIGYHKKQNIQGEGK